jgi:hypothetical protein
VLKRNIEREKKLVAAHEDFKLDHVKHRASVGSVIQTGVNAPSFIPRLGLNRNVTSIQLLFYPRRDGDEKGVAMHGNAYKLKRAIQRTLWIGFY